MVPEAFSRVPSQIVRKCPNASKITSQNHSRTRPTTNTQQWVEQEPASSGPRTFKPYLTLQTLPHALNPPSPFKPYLAPQTIHLKTPYEMVQKWFRNDPKMPEFFLCISEWCVQAFENQFWTPLRFFRNRGMPLPPFEVSAWISEWGSILGPFWAIRNHVGIIFETDNCLNIVEHFGSFFSHFWRFLAHGEYAHPSRYRIAPPLPWLPRPFFLTPIRPTQSVRRH